MSDENTKREVLKWVYKITGEVSTSDEFHQALKSGVLLCKLMNKTVGEGTITRINTQNTPFKIMENISAYISSCRKIGVRESDLFTTVDLFEGTGINQVLLNIISFARFVKEKYPFFPGPHLVVVAGKVEINLTEPKKERPRSTRITETKPSTNKKFCDTCGRKNLADTKFCIGCGTNLGEITSLENSTALAQTALTTNSGKRTDVTASTSTTTSTSNNLTPAVPTVVSSVRRPSGGTILSEVKAPVSTPVPTPVPTSVSPPPTIVKSTTTAPAPLVSSPPVVDSKLAEELAKLRQELAEAQANYRVTKKKLTEKEASFDDFKNQWMLENQQLKDNISTEVKEKKAALEKANQFAAKLDASEEEKLRAIADVKREHTLKDSEKVNQYEAQCNIAIQKAEKLANELAIQKKAVNELQNLKRHLEEESASNLKSAVEAERNSGAMREKSLLEEIERAKDAAKKIQSAVESTGAAGDEKDKKIASLQSLLNKSNDQLTQSKIESSKLLEDTTTKLKKEIDVALKLAKNSFDSKTAQLENKIEKLVSQNNELVNENEQLIMLGGTAAEGHAELENEISEANRKLKIAEEERNGARLMLHAVKEELEIFKLKSMDAKVATAALEEAAQVATRLNAAEYALADALAANKDSKKKEKDLLNELDVSKKRCDELSARIAGGTESNAESSKKILALEKVVADMKVNEEKFNGDIENLKEDINNAQDRLADAVEREEALANSLGKKHAEVTKLEAELQSSQFNFEDVLATRKSLEGEVANLRKALSDSQKKMDDSQKKIDDSQKKVDESNKQIAKVTGEKDQQIKTLEAAAVELKKLLEENRKLMDDLKKKANTPVPTSIPTPNPVIPAPAPSLVPVVKDNVLEKKVESLYIELEGCKKDNDSFKSQISTLKEKLQDAQSKLQDAQSKLQDAQSKLSQASSVAPSTSNTSVAPPSDDRFAKFEKMRKMLPEGAVRQKMGVDGFSTTEIEAFFNGTLSSLPPPTLPVVVGDGQVNERYAKYDKMKKMNMPEGAIRQKMTVDGFTEAEINAFIAGTPLPPASVSAPAVRMDLMAEIAKGKKLKKSDPVPEKVETSSSSGGGGGGGGGKGGASPAAAMNIGQLVAMKAKLRQERSDKLEGLLTDRSTEKDLKDKNIVKEGGNIAAGLAGLKLRKTSVDLNSKLKERPAPETLVAKNVLKAATTLKAPLMNKK